MILGHSHPLLIEGIEETCKKGTSYGLPTAIEIEMAKTIAQAYPGIDQVRMVNSGTEATMSAIRLARAYTKREKILKFEGCYHGHSDALLVKSGSGTLTYGVPTSPGVPEETVKNTLVGPYNDLEALKKCFETEGDALACVIVEPVAGNMGVVPAKKAFLEALRTLCDAHGVVLIFDEVITGFRLAYGGAAEVFGVSPDLACFGKIIGGGLPVGAYAGRLELMQCVSPVGPVYQAGTLSGNPLAMHMGLKTLQHLKAHPEVYETLENKAILMEEALVPWIQAKGYPVTFVRFMSMPCLFFAKGPIESYEDVMRCDTQAYGQYFREMLERGVLLPPAQYEGLFLSMSHSDSDVDAYITHTKAVLEAMYSA